jgi:AraC-like DNA-binding protein
MIHSSLIYAQENVQNKPKQKIVTNNIDSLANIQQVKTQLDLVKYYYDNKSLSEADSCLQLVKEFIGTIDNDSLLCSYHNLLWNIDFYYNQVSYNKALDYLEPAMNYCRSCSDTTKLSLVLFKTSNYHFLTKQFDQSYELATELMQISTQRNDTLHLGLAYLLHGDLNYEIQNYQRALDFYDKAIEIFYLLDKINISLQIHLKKAEAYSFTEEHEKIIIECKKGLKAYNKISEEYNKIGHSPLSFFSYGLKSRLMYGYTLTGQFEKARLLNTGLKTFLQKKPINSIIEKILNHDIAFYHFTVEEWDSAKIYYHNRIALLEAQNINYSYAKASALEDLGYIAREKKQFQKASDLLAQSMLIKDSLRRARKQLVIQVSDWETKYESMDKSHHIESLNETVDQKERELSYLNTNIILLIIFSIALIFFLIRLWQRKRRIFRENKDFKEKISLLEKKRQAIGNKNKLLEDKVKEIITELQEKEQSNQKEKYDGIHIDPEQRNRIEHLLIQLIIDDKAYLNPDLTLDTLANSLEVNRVYISQVINEQFQMNFSQLINYYRIQEACNMLSSAAYEKYTILYIAQKSGFQSISPFNRAFKKYMQETPSNYRKKMLRKISV